MNIKSILFYGYALLLSSCQNNKNINIFIENLCERNNLISLEIINNNNVLLSRDSIEYSQATPNYYYDELKNIMTSNSSITIKIYPDTDNKSVYVNKVITLTKEKHKNIFISYSCNGKIHTYITNKNIDIK